MCVVRAAAAAEPVSHVYTPPAAATDAGLSVGFRTPVGRFGLAIPDMGTLIGLFEVTVAEIWAGIIWLRSSGGAGMKSLGRETLMFLPRSCMPSRFIALFVSAAERNSRKANFVSGPGFIDTSFTHGSSSSVSVAAFIVSLKSSRSAAGFNPGGRLPMCKRRARRVTAACCCSTVFICCACICCIICCCIIMAPGGASEKPPGATVWPSAPTSQFLLRAFRRSSSRSRLLSRRSRSRLRSRRSRLS